MLTIEIVDAMMVIDDELEDPCKLFFQFLEYLSIILHFCSFACW